MTGILQGKVAVITGGCSGLGAAAVNLFEAEGARVVIADIQSDAGEARERQSSGRVKFVFCDVREEGQYAAALQAAKAEFGGLDILFNNAGVGDKAHRTIETMEADSWDTAMAINLRAGVFGMKHAVPLMRERGSGSIIHTASIAGQRAGISTVAYSVSKAALIHLTRFGAAEFAADNIRVNAICPGVIPTEIVGREFGFSDEAFKRAQPDVRKIFDEAQLIAQAGSPQDIAQLAVFLASDASRFITGQEIACDGGMTNMPPRSMDPANPEGLLQKIVTLAAKYNGGA